jgi:ribosomal protein S21
VAQACNPSYSGGRDQKDCVSKPAQGNSSGNLISKRTHHKKGLVEWLKVQALSSKPRTKRKKEKKETNKSKRENGYWQVTSRLLASE